MSDSEPSENEAGWHGGAVLRCVGRRRMVMFARLTVGTAAVLLLLVASQDLADGYRKPRMVSMKKGQKQGLWRDDSSPAALPSLFCFCVTQTQDYEILNIQRQLQLKAGIFDCDDRVILSDKEIQLASGVFTVAIGSLLTAVGSGTGPLATSSWVNTNVFFKAWHSIRETKQYLNYDWSIKVDPDTVFIPDLLRRDLAQRGNVELKAYFTTCPGVDYGFYGALEVMSKTAFVAFMDGFDDCRRQLRWHNWGEDMFSQKCLDSIGAARLPGFGLIEDGNCQGIGSAPTCNSGHLAYHPVKDPNAWQTCWQTARSASTPAGQGVAVSTPGSPVDPGTQVLGAPTAGLTGMPIPKTVVAADVYEPVGTHPFPQEAIPEQEFRAHRNEGFSIPLPGFHRLKK